MLLHRASAEGEGGGAAAARFADGAPRLRLGQSSAVAWLNDLEKDPAYRRWSPSLGILLRPAYPGRLPQLRRNLFNAVVLFGPGGVARMGKPLQTVLHQQWPLRLGIAPLLVEHDDRAAAANGLALRVVAGLLHVLGPSPALDFLIVLQEASGGSPVTQAAVSGFVLVVLGPPFQGGCDLSKDCIARILIQSLYDTAADEPCRSSEQQQFY